MSNSQELELENELNEAEEVWEEEFTNTFGTRRITNALLQRYLKLKSAEKEWWEGLPELSYAVTKINQYGKRQKRTLRLTKEGTENVRKKGKVSSRYPYEAILNVQMKNLKTFYIEYQGAKHIYQYRSPVAMHIVQEISSRLALRKKNVRRKLTSDIATTHQKKLEQSGFLKSNAQIVKQSLSNKKDNSSPQVERKTHKAKKLQNLLGASEEQRLDSAIDSLLLDQGTTEGKTLKQFCTNFYVLEKNPATLVMNVRQFMDDLRSYIMEKHSKELSKLLVEAQSQSFNPTEFSLSSVIENCLEKALIPRFKPRILACLKRPPIEEEMNLNRKIMEARTRSQQFFGISDDFVSPSGWEYPIEELKTLNDIELPSRQLATILAAAKAIYTTVNFEKNKGKGAEQHSTIFVSADDFFPIFIYVVVHSGVRQPQLLAEMLWNLCDPEKLNGEGGYYLTVFCSALEYLKNLKIEDDPENKDKAKNEACQTQGQDIPNRPSSPSPLPSPSSPNSYLSLSPSSELSSYSRTPSLGSTISPSPNSLSSPSSLASLSVSSIGSPSSPPASPHGPSSSASWTGRRKNDAEAAEAEVEVEGPADSGPYLALVSMSGDEHRSATAPEHPRPSRVQPMKRTSSAPDFRAKLESMIVDLEREVLEHQSRERQNSQSPPPHNSSTDSNASSSSNSGLPAGPTGQGEGSQGTQGKGSVLVRTGSLMMATPWKTARRLGNSAATKVSGKPVKLLKSPSRLLRKYSSEGKADPPFQPSPPLSTSSSPFTGASASSPSTSVSSSPSSSLSSSPPFSPNSSSWITVNYRNSPGVAIYMATTKQSDE